MKNKVLIVVVTMFILLITGCINNAKFEIVEVQKEGSGVMESTVLVYTNSKNKRKIKEFSKEVGRSAFLTKVEFYNNKESLVKKDEKGLIGGYVFFPRGYSVWLDKDDYLREWREKR